MGKLDNYLANFTQKVPNNVMVKNILEFNICPSPMVFFFNKTVSLIDRLD